MNADWPTNEEVAKVRRAECTMRGHSWTVIQQVGLGPTRLVCTNCGGGDVGERSAMIAPESRAG